MHTQFLQQLSSSDPSSQSNRLLHHWYVLIQACEVLHLKSPGNGHGLAPKQIICDVHEQIM